MSQNFGPSPLKCDVICERPVTFEEIFIYRSWGPSKFHKIFPYHFSILQRWIVVDDSAWKKSHITILPLEMFVTPKMFYLMLFALWSGKFVEMLWFYARAMSKLMQNCGVSNMRETFCALECFITKFFSQVIDRDI